MSGDAPPVSRAGRYTYVWEYVVEADRARDFECAYGPDGDWARLFRRARGYVRTELCQDVADPLRFVTVDQWESIEAWATFRRERSDEYEALDARCEGLTVWEREVGRFTTVG